MSTRCVVVSVIVVRLLTSWLDDQVFLAGGRRCPPLLLLASTGPFSSTVPSPGRFPPGSQVFRAPIFPSWWCIQLAVSRRLVPTPGFALVRYSLQRHGDFVLALSRQHVKLSLALSRRLVHASGPFFRVSSRQRLKSAHASFRRRFLPTRCLSIRSGLQRLVLCGDGSFSLVSELDAGSALS